MNGSWRIRRWRRIQQVHSIKYSFHPMNYSSHWQWRVASTLSCQHSLLHSSVSGPFWFKQLLKHGKAVGCFPFLAISPKRWCLHNLCKCLCSPPSWSGVSVPDCTQNVHHYRLQQGALLHGLFLAAASSSSCPAKTLSSWSWYPIQ